MLTIQQKQQQNCSLCVIFRYYDSYRDIDLATAAADQQEVKLSLQIDFVSSFFVVVVNSLEILCYLTKTLQI